VDKAAILNVDRPPFCTVKKSSLQEKLIFTNVDKTAILHVDRPPFCVL
jgi:hypothetical protein